MTRGTLNVKILHLMHQTTYYLGVLGEVTYFFPHPIIIINFWYAHI
jgi:hypothetical protein